MSARTSFFAFFLFLSLTSRAAAQTSELADPLPDVPAVDLTVAHDVDLEAERASLDGLSRDVVGYYVGGTILSTVGIASGVFGVIFMALAGIGGPGILFLGLGLGGGGLFMWEAGLAMIWSASRIEVNVNRRRRELDVAVTPIEGGAYSSLSLAF